MKLKKTLLSSALLGSLVSASATLAEGELATAVMNDQVEVVTSLLEQDANVNEVAGDGSTALQWAVYMENADLVGRLLNAGADVSLSNREGMTPLLLAVISGNAEIVELLLNAGAAVDQPFRNGETPLMMAARTGDLDSIQMLIDHGAEINARENLRGTTALMWAASYRNPPAVRLLLDNGADLSMTSIDIEPGRGPYLAPTARSRIRDFYNDVGQAGNTVSAEDAAFSGENAPEFILTRQELLARLPEELVRDFEREQELNNAQQQASDQEKQWGGLSPLHFAVREGDFASVKVLVDAGADVNQISEFGWTPLLTATQNRYYQIGKYLLEQGADPNIANEGGWNPLYIATDNRNIEGGDYPTRKPDMDHLEYIKLLLGAGADPNLRMASSTETRTIFTQQWLREEGATPFLRAAQSSDIELMKLLLEHGADPNINTWVEVTPLMVAAGIGWVEGVTYEWSEEANREAITMLLELGNDVNLHDLEDGRTALMGAAHKGRPYAVEMLVNAGADLSARDIGSRDTLHRLAGLTFQALDYAEGLARVGVQSAQIHPETAALLRRLMRERGLDVPPEGRTLESICIVDICQ